MLVEAGVTDLLDLAGVRQALGAPHGSPAHVPLQTGGVYAVVRHPIYLGWVLLVFGAPEMTGTRLVFAIVSTLYLVVAVPLEEQALRAQFGDAYRRYQRRVRWRIVPGIY
jgi:protein-S-isoprenylcysteine O-methyltransferase Ste14